VGTAHVAGLLTVIALAVLIFLRKGFASVKMS
jgi:hypothetical protein